MQLLYAIAPLLVAAKSRLASRLDDNALLRRAKAIDDWFAAPTNRTTPVAWTVRRKSDVQLWEKISSKAKTVYRGSMRGAPVIVKGKGRHAAQGDYGGDVLWEEMIYLEALRGEPGIVPLHGAWFSDDARHVSFVVGDCGPPIGKTSRDKPPLMSRAFDKRARKRPLELAKAILECFGAWASRGYILDDFKAQQFAMDDADGTVCMVDGPKRLTESPLGKAALRRWPLKGVGRRSVPRVLNNTARACRKDTDCPAFKENLSCRGEPGIHTPCETGAVGAPESRGTCLDGACLLLSEKTHVFDVANRPWLLPFIHDRATSGPERELLGELMRLANQRRPEDRPSFAELVDRIDRFTTRPRH